MYDLQPRIIPTLLMRDEGLYKTRKFHDDVYIGDPLNVIRIFNQKEVDELILLDIGVARHPKDINLDYLREIASECFMPLSYGGGIRDADTARKLFSVGIERLIINTSAYDNPAFVAALAREYGASSVIGSIDIGLHLGKRAVFISGGQRRIAADPIDWCRRMEDLGVGEIIINSIEHDGELCGYDINLIEEVCANVSVPVIASGGARSAEDFRLARTAGAHAMAAGAMFVFRGKHRAVLIKYMTSENIFGEF
jgi:cyclase